MLRGNLSNCKVGLHLINPIFDGEVRASLETFDFTLLHVFFEIGRWPT